LLRKNRFCGQVVEVQFSAITEQVTQELLQGWHTLATEALMN
jgi:hypothetical protein